MHLPLYLQHYYLNSYSIKLIPLPIFLILLAILILFTAHFFRQWYKNFLKGRLIEDNPTAKIRSAAQGYVELKGKQRYYNKTPLIAPLSKLPCTWYRYTIEKLSKNKWMLLEHGSSNEFFILEDETGECVIDPTGANVIPPAQEIWMGFNRYPNGKPKNWFWRFMGAFGRYRYQEWRMEEGMPIQAMGNFRTMETSSFNLLSGNNTSRDPFILSAQDKKNVIRNAKKEALIWLIAYISLLVVISWLMLIRFG